jgi:hypothetical protein
MNSIDGIIALCTLLAGFGVLIGAVNEEKIGTQEAMDSITAKKTAMECGAIIDSMLANAMENYSQEINCDTNENKTTASKGLKKKEFEILANAKKNTYLEVKTLEHYK